MTYFETFIDRFLTIEESNLQLDILKKNGQVFIQLFRQQDMKVWGLDFNLIDDKGYCILLFFNKQKDNNNQNYSRFKKSKIESNFIKSNSLGIEAYFLLLKPTISTEELTKLCYELVEEIYEVSDFDFVLEAY